jgi:lipopolysaccharide transport system permease protein
MGFTWAILNPLLLLAIYTFVFSIVFRVRFDGPIDDRVGFALVIYTGMLVHGFFAECITRAPSLVVENRNLVKKVVFPLHVLPWTVLSAAFFHFVIGIVLVVLVLAARTGTVPVTALAMPAIVVPLALAALGCMYAFSALGVYLRDLAQLVGFFAMVLLFASPVFYPVSAVPEEWRWLIVVNPLATLIEMTRGALLFGRWPSAAPLAAMWIVGFAMASGGFFWFQRTRNGFADVL